MCCYLDHQKIHNLRAPKTTGWPKTAKNTFVRDINFVYGNCHCQCWSHYLDRTTLRTLHTTHYHTTPHHTTPRHTTPHHTTPHHTTLRHATPRHATPRHAMPRNATQRNATQCHATQRNATQCNATPCHAMPRHATPRHATPCHTHHTCSCSCTYTHTRMHTPSQFFYPYHDIKLHMEQVDDSTLWLSTSKMFCKKLILPKGILWLILYQQLN